MHSDRVGLGTAPSAAGHDGRPLQAAHAHHRTVQPATHAHTARDHDTHYYHDAMQIQPMGAPFDGGHRDSRAMAMAMGAPPTALAAASASASATFSPRLSPMHPHHHKAAHAPMSASNQAVDSLPLLAPVPRSFLNAPRDLPSCHLVSQPAAPHPQQSDPSAAGASHTHHTHASRLAMVCCTGTLPSSASGSDVPGAKRKHGRQCRKRFCEGCLQRHHNISPLQLNPLTWICPACDGQCACDACHPEQSTSASGPLSPKDEWSEHGRARFAAEPSVSLASTTRGSGGESVSGLKYSVRRSGVHSTTARRSRIHSANSPDSPRSRDHSPSADSEVEPSMSSFTHSPSLTSIGLPRSHSPSRSHSSLLHRSVAVHVAPESARHHPYSVSVSARRKVRVSADNSCSNSPVNASFATMSLAGAAGPLHRVPVLTALAAADQRRTRPAFANPMPIQHPVPTALPFSPPSSSSLPAPVALTHLPQLHAERTPSPPDATSPSPMRAGLRAHAPIPQHIRNLPQLQPQMQTPLFQPAFEEADFSQVAVSMSDAAAPVSPASVSGSVFRTTASSSTKGAMFDFSPHAGPVGSCASTTSTPSSVRFHSRHEDAATSNESLSFGSPAPPMPQQHGRSSNMVRSLLDSSVSLSSLSPPQLASLDVDTLQWIQGALAARVAAAQMNDAHSWEMAQTQQPPQSYEDQQRQLAALTLQQQQLQLQQTLLTCAHSTGTAAASAADDSLMSDSSHMELGRNHSADGSNTGSRAWDQSLAQRFDAAAHAAMQLPPSP